MVSMDHERTDPSFVEPLETVPEFYLCSEASICPIVNVTGHQQKIDLLLKAELNHPVKGLKRGRTQDASQIRVIDVECCKGAFEMEISCVDKREIGHLRPNGFVQK